LRITPCCSIAQLREIIRGLFPSSVPENFTDQFRNETGLGRAACAGFRQTAEGQPA